MMNKIVSYNDLTNKEKLKVYKYMKSQRKFNETLENMDEIYKEKIYDYGRGVLYYFLNDEVVANLCIVLEVANKLDTAYIHNLNIILKSLIDKSKSIAKEYGAKGTIIGIKDKSLLKEVKK